MRPNQIVALRDCQIYQQDQPILSQVELTIERGEFVFMTGRTGTGKSSLLKTLYGALPLRQGTGWVAGFDLQKLTRKNIPLLRRKLGIVFQDFNLLDDRTVYQNLLFVLKATGWKKKAVMEKRIATVLDEVGLPDSQNRMPHELSGGEQQRIVIARALLNQPELLIADEPTGNLDPESSIDILRLIRRVNEERNTAVLFATHDIRTLQEHPARTISCRDGRLEA